ncbi:MAG: GGDEF domain-containing protein [Coriobacteriia bacterium]|nr:GGDEF domain-containing protein [Coriobacteriia bacterium]MBN2822018.1 GGDEF domain-containing protein [Coriobacteriia bacterium]
MEEAAPLVAESATRSGQVHIAIAGGGLRATSVLRLLSDVDNLVIVAVYDSNRSAPAIRLADDLGIFTTTEVSEFAQLMSLDLILDMSEDKSVRATLESMRPSSVEIVSAVGAELVWDLLIAKKRSEEQEKIFVELQVAYDKIRSHERRLQASKEALEGANGELESRLAEIFFTHEFFKALTSYSSVEDVASLIVDGANGILGAEISCVYLFNQEDWTLHLRASQGRPEDVFCPVVSVSETLLGTAFRDGPTQQSDVPQGSESARWSRQPEDIRSQAAIPLRAGESIIGVLVLASSTYRELTQAERDRLQVIGNQSSLALQNALLHEELERLSVTDRLTELYNHGYMQQRLEEELGRAERFGHRLSLIMLDIDDFKSFNDTYGHPRGDRVLRTVSEIIRQNLREIDVAARYGGEEFVVVLPETDIPGAIAVAERIRNSMAQHGFATGEEDGTVAQTVSLGVATFPTHAANAARLIDTADRAMYAAKRQGKNRVTVAS